MSEQAENPCRAVGPLQSGDSVDAVLITEIARVHSVLLDRMKLKYAGDCKCGDCHLVPIDVIMNAANLISYSLPRSIVEEAYRQRHEAKAAEIVDEFHPWLDGRATSELGNLERAIASALCGASRLPASAPRQVEEAGTADTADQLVRHQPDTKSNAAEDA